MALAFLTDKDKRLNKYDAIADLLRQAEELLAEEK